MKVIITDLDRTLLRSDKSLSPYTLAVLQRCRKQGMYILAASARTLRDLRRYDALVQFDAIAAGNGAVLSLPQGREEYGISRKSGEKILSALLQFPDVTLSVEVGSGLYANRDIPAWQPKVYDGFPRLPDDTALYKILASSPDRQLYDRIPELLTADTYHSVADGNLIQIMSVEATKWNGIRRMLSCFGIAPAEAVYFGDDNDDIEALRSCGLGVAVANAIPAVLDAADRIAEANDRDGVAKFIEENLLH
jgi:Cof subfamily protein (haloacid dehalogenase superfamily)